MPFILIYATIVCFAEGKVNRYHEKEYFAICKAKMKLYTFIFHDIFDRIASGLDALLASLPILYIEGSRSAPSQNAARKKQSVIYFQRITR